MCRFASKRARPFGILREDRVDDLVASLPPGANPLLPLEDLRDRRAPVERRRRSASHRGDRLNRKTVAVLARWWFDVDMQLIPPSTKEQIARVAERLLAERGLEGVSLRQISAEAGCGNNTAVQYHFGSKDQLIQAVLEYRLPQLHERRRMLIAQRRPHDLRSWCECYVLPILEQGEREDSRYLSFLAMLIAHGRLDVFERVREEFRGSSRVFREQVALLLPGLPELLRTHRITYVLTFSIHAAADRERARANGLNVLPFAVHVSDLIDGLVGFLEAPVSPVALAALEVTDPKSISRPLQL